MTQPSTGRRLLRLAPLLLLAAGFVAFFAFGLDDYVGFESLRRHHEALAAWVAGNRALAMLAYVLIYAAIAAFSLPIASLVTLVGGFLFGVWLGGGLTVLGATAGSLVVFVAARTGLRESFAARAGGALRRMEEGFRANAFSYLLFLRLVPIFPFWLVNIVPALLGMRLGSYALGTLLGIAPGSFVYASVGSGLGALLETGRTPDLALVFEPEYLLPILGLAVLSLAPVVYRRWRGRRPPPGMEAGESDGG